MLVFIIELIIFGYIVESNNFNPYIGFILFVIFIINIGIYLKQEKLDYYE